MILRYYDNLQKLDRQNPHRRGTDPLKKAVKFLLDVKGNKTQLHLPFYTLQYRGN